MALSLGRVGFRRAIEELSRQEVVAELLKYRIEGTNKVKLTVRRDAQIGILF